MGALFPSRDRRCRGWASLFRLTPPYKYRTSSIFFRNSKRYFYLRQSWYILLRFRTCRLTSCFSLRSAPPTRTCACTHWTADASSLFRSLLDLTRAYSRSAWPEYLGEVSRHYLGEIWVDIGSHPADVYLKDAPGRRQDFLATTGLETLPPRMTASYTIIVPFILEYHILGDRAAHSKNGQGCVNARSTACCLNDILTVAEHGGLVWQEATLMFTTG